MSSGTRQNASKLAEVALEFAEEFGMNWVFAALDSQTIVDVLLRHKRYGHSYSSGAMCTCGWLGTGQARHVLDKIIEAVREEVES